MPADNEFYQDPDVFQGVASDNLVLKFLALNGINKMPIPFKAIPGRPEKPSYSCQEDNRTGIYFPELGVVGVVRNGVDVLWVLKDTLRLFDRYGNHIDLVISDTLTDNFTLSLPRLDGTVALKEHIVSEEIIGTKDGFNTSFTVTHPIQNILGLTLNGVGDQSYVSWTLGSNALTWIFATIPNTGDKVYVTYLRQ